MALSDLVLNARVHLALAKDPRVGVLDIGVTSEGGVVKLTGDLDTEDECAAAESIVRSVEGVADIDNQMTCGLGARADTAEMVRHKFIERLTEAWNELPNQHALTQADYLRWALWMVYKFRIPEEFGGAESEKIEAETVDEAMGLIAGFVNAPRALVALEMLRQAESVAEFHPHGAPDIENAPLTATPVVDGDKAAA